jgi:hypothetical protein
MIVPKIVSLANAACAQAVRHSASKYSLGRDLASLRFRNIAKV